MTTTWNPSDASANVSFSGGNLIASYNTTPDAGVRSTSNSLSSKIYFEASITAGFASGDNGVGISIAGASFVNLANNATSGVILFRSGNIYVNGTNTLASGLSLVPQLLYYYTDPIFRSYCRYSI